MISSVYKRVENIFKMSMLPSFNTNKKKRIAYYFILFLHSSDILQQDRNTYQTKCHENRSNKMHMMLNGQNMEQCSAFAGNKTSHSTRFGKRAMANIEYRNKTFTNYNSDMVSFHQNGCEGTFCMGVHSQHQQMKINFRDISVISSRFHESKQNP